jgi:hypothetical protein
MRLNGNGALTLEDARTWIEETGLCLFLPKRQYSTSIAPSFVEAIAGQRNPTPEPKQIAFAEELLVRLETDGVAVRLNLLGLPGEQPDFVVASWVLPYVYALRGDRDWRRSPQLTGSRQVSQLAVQAYKQLESGDATITALRHALGREVSESAVLRAITELWQQLRIIPVIAAPGQAAKWQLLRTRYQKAIAEGASTSQVTAISVLASIYLQAVIAASMEEVELFLSPLTARSKVREVLRGLVATRQVHTISMGHAPHFYVAGTLPEFAVAPTLYSSSSMSASAYFFGAREHEDEMPEPAAKLPAPASAPAPIPRPKAAEPHAPRVAARKPAAAKAPAPRPHFSRTAAHSRDRKPGQSLASRTARRSGPETRSSSARPAGARSTNGARPAGSRPTNGTRPTNGARPAASSRWTPGAAKNSSGPRAASHAGNGSSNGARPKTGSSRPASGASAARGAKSAAPAWTKRNGNGAKAVAKSGANARAAGRKPALAAGTKAGNSKRFGFTASKQGAKKRG